MRKSATILPCGVSSAPNRPRPGWIRSRSVVTRPLRKLRASSPLTLTTPRSGRNAAFILDDAFWKLPGMEFPGETPVLGIAVELKALRCREQGPRDTFKAGAEDR